MWSEGHSIFHVLLPYKGLGEQLEKVDLLLSGVQHHQAARPRLSGRKQRKPINGVTPYFFVPS